MNRNKNNKSKVKTKKTMLRAILFIVIILLACCAFYFTKKHNKVSKENEKNIITEKKEVKKEEKPKVEKEKKITLIAGGDALIHDTVYNSARVKGGFDFRPKLEKIKPIVKKYDLAYYNQETILAGRELPLSNYPLFCSPTEVGDAYIDAGFNLVSLATNHTMDKGTKGVNASLKYWNSKKDKIMFHGSASSKKEAEKIDIREANGIKYTMLSYRMPELSNGLPSEFEYQVNNYTYEKAKKDIEKVKDKVDLLIVSMHWGVEDADYRTEKQLKVAKELSSLGVDLILGTHSHVIQPIERVNDTVVIYSLGNFISDQIPTKNLIGDLVSMDIKLKNNKINIDNIGVRLMYTDERQGYKVIPFDQLSTNALPNKKQMYNYFKKVLTSLSDEVKMLN